MNDQERLSRFIRSFWTLRDSQLFGVGRTTQAVRHVKKSDGGFVAKGTDQVISTSEETRGGLYFVGCSLWFVV